VASPFARAIRLLDRAERWRWAALVPLAVLVAGIEMVGAGAVFVLIRIVADPAYRLPPFLRWLSADRTPHETLVALGALVVVFYLARTIVLVNVEYLQERLVQRSSARIAIGLLRRYLFAPYAFHFRHRSAGLVQNIFEGAETVVERVLAAVVHIASESLIVAGLLLTLAVAAPMPTLVAMVVVLVLLAIALTTTRRVYANWGREEQELGERLIARLHQSLAAVKDIIVTGRAPQFAAWFERDRLQMRDIRARRVSAGTAVRLTVETVFACGMVAAVVLLATSGRSGGDAVSVLSLFAYAGFRIVPSANRIILNANMVRYGVAYATVLDEDWRSLPASDTASAVDAWPRFGRDIVVDDVSYEYGDGRGHALRGVCLRIARGESIGIAGPTGSGKSTLVDVILGLLTPGSGRVLADGRDIAANVRGWQMQLGYVAQQVTLLDDSLRRNIAFGLDDSEIDDARVVRAASEARLDELIASLPGGLDANVGERGIRLSGGERQRIAIARALYRNPAVLVFDEATAALDHATEREIVRAIDDLRGERTVIVIAHRMTTVRGCDRIVVLDAGAVAAEGRYDELRLESELFRSLAGT